MKIDEAIEWMEDLKPCPFCDGEAEVNYVDLGGYEDGYEVRCPDCGCGTDYFYTKQEAIEAWNRRAYETK